MTDWDSQCLHGVVRRYSAQHGRCASCTHYEISQHFPNKCWFWIKVGSE